MCIAILVSLIVVISFTVVACFSNDGSDIKSKAKDDLTRKHFEDTALIQDSIMQDSLRASHRDTIPFTIETDDTITVTRMPKDSIERELVKILYLP